jgi:hypothetical protein
MESVFCDLFMTRSEISKILKIISTNFLCKVLSKFIGYKASKAIKNKKGLNFGLYWKTFDV